MATLCLDTATQHGVVVVARDGGPPASVRWRSIGRHGEHLFGHIETAMDEARVKRTDLSVVGASIGPGGFTSLRVGLATAKGLALGLDLPIVGVSSLRVLARSIEGSANMVRVPLMNAYRGDLFAAAYRMHADDVDVLVAPFFGRPADVLTAVREVVGGAPVGVRGEGVAPHRALIESIFDVVAESGDDVACPGAEALLEEVRLVHRTEGPADLATLEPTYLRSSDARLPTRPLRTDHSA
jgi:tRNA threonylcarbamoyl adenosine modification protein YeaZ